MKQSVKHVLMAGVFALAAVAAAGCSMTGVAQYGGIIDASLIVSKETQPAHVQAEIEEFLTRPGDGGGAQ